MQALHSLQKFVTGVVRRVTLLVVLATAIAVSPLPHALITEGTPTAC
jgi:hypothetical protein